MPKPQPTAREQLIDAINVTDYYHGGTTPDELLDAYRDQVLTEAAELIHAHRGDLDDDAPWFDTRDRDTAARLLLAARTAPDAP